MDLFSFDYSSYAVEKTTGELLSEVVSYCKAQGNPPRVSVTPKKFSILNDTLIYDEVVTLSSEAIFRLDELQQLGYLEWDGQYIYLNEEYRDYHTSDEIAAIFCENVDRCLKNGGDYYSLLRIRTWLVLSYQCPDTSKIAEKELDRYAIKLGLQHFLAHEGARGERIGLLNRREHAAITKRVSNELLLLSHWEEVQWFFRTHVFERRENDILCMSPSVFLCQCMAQATDQKTIQLILEYIGGHWVHGHSKGYIVLRPEEQITLF